MNCRSAKASSIRNLSFPRLVRPAISIRLMALKARGSLRRTAPSISLSCSRENLLASISQRTRICVSNKKRGSNDLPYSGRKASHKSAASLFTISPTIWALPAQLLVRDFDVPRFTGSTIATECPRLVILIDSLPRCTSSSKDRHLAWNSVAFTTFTCSDYHGYGHLTGQNRRVPM